MAGGLASNNGSLASTEIFDPATNTWATGPNLPIGIWGHVAGLLNDGRVLIAAGGASPTLYDPATNSMSAAGAMAVNGLFGAMTVLANGQALVVGGQSGATVFSATALYNPTTNTWSASGSLAVGRYSHQAARMADGNVMVTGGLTVSNNGLSGTASVEIYNVATGIWQTVAPTPTPLHSYSQLVLLPSADLLMIGGRDAGSGTPYNSTFSYNPALNNWTNGSTLINARAWHTATTLGNGKVLVSGGRGAGGQEILSAEIRDADVGFAITTLTAVQSRKTHGAAGTFDLLIDTTPAIGGLVTVEPRAIGTGHQMVFQFNQAVTAIGTTSAIDVSGNPIGTVNAAINTSNTTEVIVTLTGVADVSRVTISQNGVNGSLNVATSIGFLVGDVNNSRSVSNADISAVKIRAGQVLDATNFKFDLNASGGISNSDITAVKSRAGSAL